MGLRLVTLNLEGLEKRWFDERFEATVRQLRPHRPDVLCLQEVTVCHRDGGMVDQARDLGEALGLGFTCFDTYGEPEEVDEEHQDGLAIVSRWPFSYVRDRRLPQASKDQPDGRVVLLARLLHPDGPLDVLTTHLAWRPGDDETRTRQARMIVDVFAQEALAEQGARAVLTGDFNAAEDEEVVRTVSQRLRDAWREAHPDDPGHTWVKRNPHTRDDGNPDRRLDYVFLPDGPRVREARIVCDQEDPVFPSDHFGVLVDLEW